MEITHAKLCEIAVRWLKRPPSAGGHGCHVALSECKSGQRGEIPDALGFRADAFNGGSIVVEAKISRSDFLADSKKPHRKSGGVGNWRYFIAPAGLIKISELPDKWGLIEVNQRGHTRAVHGVAAHYSKGYQETQDAFSKYKFDSDSSREVYILTKTLAAISDPQSVLKRIREAENNANYLAKRLHDCQQELGRIRIKRLVESPIGNLNE